MQAQPSMQDFINFYMGQNAQNPALAAAGIPPNTMQTQQQGQAGSQGMMGMQQVHRALGPQMGAPAGMPQPPQGMTQAPPVPHQIPMTGMPQQGQPPVAQPGGMPPQHVQPMPGMPQGQPQLPQMTQPGQTLGGAPSQSQMSIANMLQQLGLTGRQNGGPTQIPTTGQAATTIPQNPNSLQNLMAGFGLNNRPGGAFGAN